MNHICFHHTHVRTASLKPGDVIHYWRPQLRIYERMEVEFRGCLRIRIPWWIDDENRSYAVEPKYFAGVRA